MERVMKMKSVGGVKPASGSVSITNRDFFRFIVRISVPLLLQNVLMQSLEFIDQIMISSLGTEEIAAIGVCTKIVSLYFAALYGGGSGCMFFMTQYYGKKDYKNYRQMFGTNVSFCVALGAIMAILVFVFPGQLMRIFNNDPKVVECGIKYFRLAGMAYVLNGLAFPISYALRGIGKVRQTLIITLISVIANAVLNYIFIFGLFGITPMGVQGAALGTVISRAIELFCYVVWIYKTRFQLLIFEKDMFCLTVSRFKQYLSRVIPLILNEIMWQMGFVVYFIIYGRQGTDVLAAMSIMNTLLMVSKLLLAGFSGASQIAIGQALGKKDEQLVNWYIRRFILIAVAAGVGAFVFVLLLIQPVQVLYGIAGTTIGEYVKQCMVILSIYSLLDALTCINVEGVFRAGGDSKFVAFIDMGSVWIIGVTFTFITGYVLKLPVSVMYFAIVATEIYKLPIVYHRLKSKKWINYA